MKKVMLAILLSIGVPEANAIPKAYREVANQFAIPVEVFYALILQESGRSTKSGFKPWPWTLNVAHQPYRYSNRIEAETALLNFIQQESRIAVGLGQIYLPAHGHVFEHVSTLLSPRVNLEYAASLLASEYRYLERKGKANWWLAAGRYHHPSKEHYAKEYRSLVYLKCRKISAQCQMYGEIK